MYYSEQQIRKYGNYGGMTPSLKSKELKYLHKEMKKREKKLDDLKKLTNNKDLVKEIRGKFQQEKDKYKNLKKELSFTEKERIFEKYVSYIQTKCERFKSILGYVPLRSNVFNVSLQEFYNMYFVPKRENKKLERMPASSDIRDDSLIF